MLSKGTFFVVKPVLLVQLDLLSASIKLNLDIKIFWISVIYLFKAFLDMEQYLTPVGNTKKHTPLSVPITLT